MAQAGKVWLGINFFCLPTGSHYHGRVWGKSPWIKESPAALVLLLLGFLLWWGAKIAINYSQKEKKNRKYVKNSIPPVMVSVGVLTE